MCIHRMIGAQHPPHHVPGERDRDRCRVVGDLEGQCTCRRKQFVGRVHTAHESAPQRLVGAEDAARQRPLLRLGNTHDSWKEPR
jgi:hypothetical protein